MFCADEFSVVVTKNVLEYVLIDAQVTLFHWKIPIPLLAQNRHTAEPVGIQCLPLRHFSGAMFAL